MILKELKWGLVFFIIFSAVACKEKHETPLSAQNIIDSSILAHGGKNYAHLDLSFTFRQYRVRLQNEEGKFNYSRIFKDSTGNTIKDVLVNDGFTRTVNDTLQVLPDEKKKSLAASVNSVAYFALLPYKLSEPAVVAEYLGDTSFKNNSFYKIGIGYKATGKQNDHQDDYCFWINKNDYRINYIAYKTGGPRMRVVTAAQNCGGIVLQDYDNYAMEDSTVNVKFYDRYLLEGKMKLLSKIENSDFVNNLVTPKNK